MRINRFIIILISLTVFMASSCDDFLTENPNGQLSSESAFTEHGDLESSLTALYKLIRNQTNGSMGFSPTLMGSDLSTHRASNKINFRQYDRFAISADNGNMNGSKTGSWRLPYKTIKCCNYIINGVDNTPDATADELTFIKGQAYYWRAYSYFHLVKNWGAIPLVLEQEVDEESPLASVREVYDQIISDLQEAEKLPENYDESPYAMNGVNVVVSKAAAEATLGYVYLTMAGWPLNIGNEYYTKAATELKKVIDGVDNGTYYYKLYEDFKDIHSKKFNWSNTETILAVYYSTAFSEGDNGQSSRGGINDLPAECGAWNDTRAEIGFWHKFPTGPRKDATYGPKLYVKDWDRLVDWWEEDTQQQPYFIKSAYTRSDSDEEYDYTKSYSSQAYGWQDQAHICIRLAEVYCWYAEAVGRSGSSDQKAKAVEVLNQVINRAKSPDDLPLNGSESLDVLAERAYDEHGWEIAGWYWGSIGALKYNEQRMDRLKDHFAERVANELIEVSPGIFMKEPIEVTGTWNDEMNYSPYPEGDVILNSNFDNSKRLNSYTE